MSQWFWRQVWITAEAMHINLGRLGPFVFGKMLGATRWEQVDSMTDDEVRR